jgi:hypothetical protein
MKKLDKIKWNVSKLILKDTFLKGANASEAEMEMVSEIRSLLGEETFVKLCSNIMGEKGFTTIG